MRRIGLAILVVAVSTAGAAALGIGGAPLGIGARVAAPTRALAQAGQIAAGRQVFEQVCSSCHGDHGEGIEDAPAVIGPDNELADYRTAARLYNFISSEMPDDDPGTLSAQEYYDVLAYLLDQNAMNPDGQPVTQATAASISLQ